MSARGFTLLEALVVLAVMALATAMVAPSSVRAIDSWRRASDAEAVFGAIVAWPDVARREGKARHLASGLHDQVPGVPLPDGWHLDLESSLIVHPNGACSGTSGVLRDDQGGVRAFRLEAPFCRLRLPPP